MNAILSKLKQSTVMNDDIIYQEILFYDVAFEAIYLKSLIDMKTTIPYLKQQLFDINITRNKTKEKILNMGEKAVSVKESLDALFEGKLLIGWDQVDFIILIDPANLPLNRSIESPVNENVIQGSLHSFNEDLLLNIGLMRKNYRSPNLRVKNYVCGTTRKRALSLLYIEGTVEKSLYENIDKQLKKSKHLDLHNLQDVSKILSLNDKIIIPKMNTTELPQEAADALGRGRVVLFVETLPMAIIIPSVIWDMFTSHSDYNFPIPMLIALRSLRILGILIALIVPGLYVALVAVNPEILRIELALSIAQSREGVPYPALIEMIFMLLIMELIIEASVRLPGSIGPTITMVGGIILGQAVVEAKLVSNMMIIVLAATTIASSTITGFQNSIPIRLFKYVIVVFAAIFGILGILVGFLVICTYVSSITTLSIPYLNFYRLKGGKKSG